MFQIADEADIKSGKITDVYFARTAEILKAKGIKKRAKAEIILKGFPSGWNWSVLAGIEEAARLLEGLPINVWAMREGTVFSTYQPVMVIEGVYLDYAVYETALLGFLCQASGIATQAARCKIAAGERQVISFGARRMHPVLAPMIERNAYIGGCDGVAVIKSAELIKADPVGTIPHSLILMLGDTVAAVKAFDEVIDPKVRRVALIDTLQDEKFEALRVAEAMGERLFAVRLDTPSSRRGDMLRILKEVRWELDFRGYNYVKLFVSGGVDEYEILRLNPAADAYGVGTSISNAPVINFALDIMEIEGKPMAKRGKPSGAKAVLRCRKCYQTEVVPAHQVGATGPTLAGSPLQCPCGGELYNLLEPLIQEGKLVAPLPAPKEIRSFVLGQAKAMRLSIEPAAGKPGYKGE